MLSFQLCFIIKLITKPYPYVHRSKNEKYFIDPKTGDNILFPSIKDKYSLNLSVIVPAYNEENRCKYVCLVIKSDLIYCFLE